MKKVLFLTLFYCASQILAQSSTSIIFSEIMFNPSSSNSEFIEIYNSSSQDTINLNSIKIQYADSIPDSIISAGNGTKLNPKQYALILEGDYDFDSGVYNSLIPHEALVVKIADNSFGTLGMANSSDRNISIINLKQDTISQYKYSANNNSGYSDEKIILNHDNSISNWENSKSMNGTPGFMNSISPFNYDLGISKSDYSPQIPLLGKTVQLNLQLKNLGLHTAHKFQIKIYNDTNVDSIGESNELINDSNFDSLGINDSATIKLTLNNLHEGINLFIAKIFFDKDEDLSNNNKIISINVVSPSYSYNDLVVNEIMYAPASGNSEWVELYNKSEKNINLKNFTISDNSTPNLITDGTKILLPNNFILIAKDSSIFQNYNIKGNVIVTNFASLNNNGDAVVIKDSLNRIIDSVNYSPSWGGENGNSLERVSVSLNSNSPSNWKGSRSYIGATPNKVNSVSQKDYDISVKQILFNPPNPVLSDNVTISVKILNVGKKTATFKIQLWNDQNLDSTADNMLEESNQLSLNSGDSLIYKMNYSLSNISKKHGYLVRVISPVDQDTTNNSTYKLIQPGYSPSSIVVNEIMFEPSNDEPEWIELYNKTNYEINLKDWIISDIFTTPTEVPLDNSIVISPNSYLVISGDSSIFDYHKNIPAQVLIINVPMLNNGVDGVVLKDNRGIKIDSVLYNRNWMSNSGTSIERISVKASSTDSSNWGSSNDIEKSTPGRQNSITPKDLDLAVSRINLVTKLPIAGSDLSFSSEIKNVGKMNATNFEVQFYYSNDSTERYKNYLGSKEISNLTPNDSLTVISPNSISNFKSEIFITAKINFSQDENATNNFLSHSITPVYSKNSIVINEIMFDPKNDEPEWIELYNKSKFNIELNNWIVSDVLTVPSREKIKASLSIPSDSYLVISKDSTILNYHNNISSNLFVMNLPVLNNDSDGVVIKDNRGLTMDSVFYKKDWMNITGSSIERISSAVSSNDSSNWGSSKDIEKSTPGRQNSLTQKNFDLKISNINFNPTMPLVGSDISVASEIKNVGKMNVNNFEVQFYYSNDSTDLYKNSLDKKVVSNLSAGDSVKLVSPKQITNLNSKIYVTAKVNFLQDEDLTNNFLSRSIRPGYPTKSLVINEIMFDPKNGEPEWIELYNNSRQSINLRKWKVSDVYTTPTDITINDSALIPPAGYIVISSDSAILNFHKNIPSKILVFNLPTLNNDADGIVLKDNQNFVIDSVLYNRNWMSNSGTSIERISVKRSSNDSTNWGSSTDAEQSTPGRQNSLTKKDFDLNISNLIFNPEFPLEGSNVTVSAKIKNAGKSNANSFEVHFYYSNDSTELFKNSLGNKTISNLAAGDSILITAPNQVSNLKSQIFASAKITYSLDEDSTNNFISDSIKPGFPENSLVINEIMFNPNEGESEWIELKNISKSTINLKDWFISDVFPNQNFKKINNNINIKPKGYLVIASDSSFLKNHEKIKSNTLILNFGTLGNSYDGIVITDFRKDKIDSIIYNSDWGNKKGFSLERRSDQFSSNDSTNWATSISPNRSTPAEINSLIDITAAKRNDLVINEIMFAPNPGNSEFVEFYNYRKSPINIGGWSFTDEQGNKNILSDTSFTLKTSEYFLVASDSSFLKNYDIPNRNYHILNYDMGLNNNGELILLKDELGNVVDSVYYSKNWHNSNFLSAQNISLERINPISESTDPLNWSSSTNSNGATPLKQNSIYSVNPNNTSTISISPNPFSPDNDGYEDFTVINYKLTQKTSQIRIRIFDNRGRLVRTLANNRPSGSTGSIIFNGLDDEGRTLRIGIYIVYLEALNNSNGVINAEKAAVVVARKF